MKGTIQFMSRHNFQSLFLVAATMLTSGGAFGQVDIQLRAKQLPGWDARAREGRCEIHVWVDNRAEVRMRGDQIFVRTLEGANSRDEGSQCSQPLPYNSVRDFQIRQTDGRNPVNVAQPPSRMNNYTATMSIVDPQNGGDNYAFEVSWRADTDVATAPAPFFDDVRACQETVRQRFVSQNRRGSYIDFENFADRQGPDQDRGRGRGQGQNYGRNRNQETIRGRGSARSPNESRDLNYSCIVDTQRNQVLSGDYQFAADGVRTDDRVRLR
jgi:hypothetical protein